MQILLNQKVLVQFLDNPVNNPENGTPNTPTGTGGYGKRIQYMQL